MAVSPHPSVKPSKPYKPPATSTTQGTINKIDGNASGQHGVHYGFRHEISVKNPNRSEMAAHFTSHKEGSNEGSTSRASKPGSETDKNDVAK